MSKPSILFIPGSFCGPEMYNPVFEAVRNKGYEIRGLHLATVGLKAREVRPGVPPTMYDDAAFIRKEVEKLADEGKDVILIAHSYGGLPTTESTKGASKAERESQGKKGGIVRIAYMTAIVPAVGESLATSGQSAGGVNVKVLESGWLRIDDIAGTAAFVLQDMPSEVGLAVVEEFACHSAVSFTNELTHAGYKDIPVSYLVCEIDTCIPLESQKRGIENIERSSGKKVHVTSINAAHIPNISAFPKVVGWIEGVAEKA